MAKMDVPQGFIYDQKTRGAFNPTTGARLSRRAVEKARIAAESGTSGSYEAKAAKRELMNIRLPRRLKVHHKTVHGPRIELPKQDRYRVRTFPEVIATISALPNGAEVYVKMYARSRLVKYRGKRIASPLIWVALGLTFRAEDVVRESRLMLTRRSDYFDIRAYDIIVRAIHP